MTKEMTVEDEMMLRETSINQEDVKKYVNENNFEIEGFISNIIRKNNYVMVILAMPKYSTDRKTNFTNFPIIVFTGEDIDLLNGYSKQDYVVIKGNIYSGKYRHNSKPVLRLSGKSIEKSYPTESSFKYTKLNKVNLTGKVTFVNYPRNNLLLLGIKVIKNKQITLCTVEYPSDNAKEIADQLTKESNVKVEAEFRTRVSKDENNKMKTFINVHAKNIEILD